MAMGMDLLMQSMGFDPKVVQEKFTEAKTMMDKTLQHFDQRLNALEAKQDRILELLQEQKKEEKAA